ncbi:MAG: DUF1573 domain-containing protein [Phycisphaerales bacterium]
MNVLALILAVNLLHASLATPGPLPGAGGCAFSLPSVANPPVVIVDSTDPIDCGRIPIGGVARRVFSIRNNTDSLVSLSVAGKSCVCLVTRLDSEKLAPGSSTTLDVSVVVAGGYGQQSHSLRLEAASQSQGGKAARQSVDLGISFVPDRQYDVVPRSLVIRSIIGEAKRGAVSIITPPGSDLLIRDIDPGSDALVVKGPSPSPKNRAVQVMEYLATPKQPGSRQYTMSFGTNSDSLPTGSIDVTIVGLTPWRADPPGLVVTYSPPEVPQVVSSTLTPRRETPKKPSRVVLGNEVAGIKVWLDGDRVMMSVDPAQVPSRTGSTVAELRTDTGDLCAQLPVVWYARRPK